MRLTPHRRNSTATARNTHNACVSQLPIHRLLFSSHTHRTHESAQGLLAAQPHRHLHTQEAQHGCTSHSHRWNRRWSIAYFHFRSSHTRDSHSSFWKQSRTEQTAERATLTHRYLRTPQQLQQRCVVNSFPSSHSCVNGANFSGTHRLFSSAHIGREHASVLSSSRVHLLSLHCFHPPRGIRDPTETQNKHTHFTAEMFSYTNICTHAENAGNTTTLSHSRCPC